jgi:FAD/FMN-containing dehydrogenase
MIAASLPASLPASLLRDLERSVAARVLTAEGDLAPYARDFGGLVRQPPAAVVPVRTEAEIRAVLRRLRGAGVPVTVRGSGFSSDGQVLGPGVVLALEPESEPCRLTPGGAEVSARARWSSFAETLCGVGLMPPVLTYSLQTSIGGTLSAGGYGPASIAAGAQVDHVRRLRVILPDGEALWCSPGDPGEQGEIFRFALAGMGRVGLIERAEMEVVPDRPALRLETREHRDLQELAAHAVAAEGDVFFADCLFGSIGSVRSIRSTTGYEDEAGTFPRERLHAQVPAAAEPFVHVWCDYFVDRDALGPFLDFIDRGIADQEIASRGLDRVHILAILRPEEDSARAYPPLAAFAGSHYYGVGVFYSLPETDPGAIRGARAAQRALLGECLRLEGRPYLCGAHDLADPEIGAIYGEDHHALERLRDRLDPDRLFNRLSRLPLRST